MKSKFINFLKGYLIIEVRGGYIERFINLSLKKGIKITQLKKTDINCIQLKISIKDFFKLRGIGRITRCKINIAHKSGAVFLLKRYKKRTALFTGVLLFFVIVKLMSSFVITINVKGNNVITKETVLSQLKENGLYRGVPVNKISPTQIAEKMMASNQDIAWIGVTINGSRAKIEIVEKKEKPLIYDDETPYNIVSTCDGVIESLYLKKGFPVVQKNDIIKKGDLLVSGVTDSNFLEARYVNSDADISIITWEKFKSTMPLTENADNFTGKKIANRHVEIAGRKIGISRKIPYKYYSIKTKETKLPFGIKYVKIENFENVPKKIVHKEKEVIEKEKKKMYNKLIGNLNENYKIEESQVKTTNDGVNVTVEVLYKITGPFCEKIPIQK